MTSTSCNPRKKAKSNRLGFFMAIYVNSLKSQIWSIQPS